MEPGTTGERLSAVSPTTRFTSRAKDYAKYRPGYPEAAYDAMLWGLDDPARLLVADVGAGTGIAARALALRGCRVYAIEPNQAMREEARPHPRVFWRDATAERTRLKDAEVDLVVCAQSFHWFDPRTALVEMRRVLKERGYAALMWNERSLGHPVTEAYYRLVREAALENPPTLSYGPIDEQLRAAGFRNVRKLRFANEQRLDGQGLLGRALSASYIPKSGPRYERLAAGLRAVHSEHADAFGHVVLGYETSLYLGEKPLDAGPL